jgi:GT2 family glycosyltransferase
MRHVAASVLNVDRARLTIDVLEKLAQLSRDQWAVEMILVDNGSRADQVRQLLDWLATNRSRFAQVLFVSASLNLGVNGGRNVAFKLASADRILILDNDVILPSDASWLEALWMRMDDDPETAIVTPMLTFADHPDIVQAAGIGLTDRGRAGYLYRGKSVKQVPFTPIQVVAAPAACWLLRREAQQAVGLFSDEFFPAQFEDVDFCIRLGLAGWRVQCDRNIRIKHIGNVTIGNLKDYPFARLTVRQGVRFREKWAHVLPEIATISEEDIYWGPIPCTES